MSIVTSIKPIVPFPPKAVGADEDAIINEAIAVAPIRSYRTGPAYMIEAEPVPPAISASSAFAHVQFTVAQAVYDFHGAPRHMYRIQSKEGQDVLMRARPVTPEGVVIKSDSVYAVVFMLFDDSRDDQTDPVHQEELTVSEVMLPALLLDSSWKYDSTGYTMKHRIGGDLLVEGGRTYRAEYTLKTDDYGTIGIDAEIETLPRRTPRTYFAS